MTKENREYRNFAVSNFRPVENEPYTVRGYFTTFDEPYVLYEDYDGPIYERVSPNALDGADMSDVIFQFDHNGLVMARQRNKSLEVGYDEHGGWCRAFLGGCQQGRDLYEAITNELIDRMSFGFIIDRDGYSWDMDTRTSTITAIRKVFDVSAVSIPANPGTEIHARSYLDGVIEMEKQQEMLQRASWQRRKRIAAAMELMQL